MDIRKNIDLFNNGYEKNGGRHPDERYSSFDYCFNYFQEFREDGRISEIASPEKSRQTLYVTHLFEERRGTNITFLTKR